MVNSNRTLAYAIFLLFVAQISSGINTPVYIVACLRKRANLVLMT
ncbi:MAG: hypothetical protein ACI9T9_000254 [Oleiphilaceae bacterium]|jgi:hypothetical protein